MRINIVLTGYYFKYIELYKKIVEETQLYDEFQFTLYILSHKLKEEISKDIYCYLKDNNWKIIYYKNIGWDWGCHCQFINWHVDNNIMEKPEYILFLHDDIKIIKNGFIKAFMDKVSDGYELVGNSKPFTKINSFNNDYFDEAFILKKNGFNFELGSIGIVRGSAFFISYELARQTLYNLPYQKQGNIDLANRSLRMFGAVVTKMIKRGKIGYLSNKHFISNYIVEEMRGSNVKNGFFVKRFVRLIFFKLLYFLDKIFISKVIFNHNFPFVVDNKLKLFFSSNEFKQGYLNISLKDNVINDIDINDFENLLQEKMIHKILFSNSIPFEHIDYFKLVMSKMLKHKSAIDIFIEISDISKNEIKRFTEDFDFLNIKFEKHPNKSLVKWKEVMYIDFPNGLKYDNDKI